MEIDFCATVYDAVRPGSASGHFLRMMTARDASWVPSVPSFILSSSSSLAYTQIKPQRELSDLSREAETLLGYPEHCHQASWCKGRETPAPGLCRGAGVPGGRRAGAGLAGTRGRGCAGLFGGEAGLCRARAGPGQRGAGVKVGEHAGAEPRRRAERRGGRRRGRGGRAESRV